jgi:hypothetical protein
LGCQFHGVQLYTNTSIGVRHSLSILIAQSIQSTFQATSTCAVRWLSAAVFTAEPQSIGTPCTISNLESCMRLASPRPVLVCNLTPQNQAPQHSTTTYQLHIHSISLILVSRQHGSHSHGLIGLALYVPVPIDRLPTQPRRSITPMCIAKTSLTHPQH